MTARDEALAALAGADVGVVSFAVDQDAYERGRDAIAAAYPDAFTVRTNQHGSPDVSGACESVFVDSTHAVLVSPPTAFGRGAATLPTGPASVADYDQTISEALEVVRSRSSHGVLVYGIYRDKLGNLGWEAVFGANPSDRDSLTMAEVTAFARLSLTEVRTFWATMGVAE